MTIDDTSRLRLQLLANGYQPIPNDLKRCLLVGWADAAYLARENRDKYASDADVVRSWARRFPGWDTTGVRLTGGLGAIDGDLNDDALAQLLWDIIERLAPHIITEAPLRYAKGDCKCAWFIRIEGELFNMLRSRAYARPAELAAWRAARAAAAPGDVVAPPALHRVEIFGGAPTRSGQCSRQFGVYGPHSRNERGEVISHYRWVLPVNDLLATPLAKLPTGDVELAKEIIRQFDAAMAQDPAWEALTLDDTGGGTDAGEIVYDIDEATRFDTNHAGRGLSYAELCDAYEVTPAGGLRCSTSFIAGRGGQRDDHGKVAWNERHDCVGVWVFGDEAWHLPKEAAPFSEYERLAELISDVATPAPIDGEPPEPTDTATLADKLRWLLQTRAYFEGEGSVVQLYATNLNCQSKLSSFVERYRAWFDQSDKRKKPVFATDAWTMASVRKHIVGVRMRPDRPFPLYEEHGQLYKNTYRPPRHDGAGGEVETFLKFMERFIPDPVEREWQLDWMAHKLRRPEIPGTALVFVADTIDGTREGAYGTGRGLMFRIAHLLYGEQYARAQNFSVLEGSSSQSAFNDWLHGAVLVTVDEAKTSPTAYKRGERNATYEVLKDIVDPAPKRFTFTGKYRQAFDGMSYCSIWLASNHSDALAIPAGDRRFTVLRNGRPIAPAEAVAIDAWMLQPANIGRLAAMLGQRDLSGFNMFVPLETAGKTEMADAARTEVDELMRDLIADPKRGLVFTRGALEQVVEAHFGRFAGMWQGDFKGAWPRYCCILKDENGKPKRAQYGGTRDNLVCFREHYTTANALPQAALRREAAKWNESGVHQTPLSVVKTPHEE